MKKIKRFLAMILAIVLVFGTITVSNAATGSTLEREQNAKVLSALGLFKGYDNTGTNFGLNDKATREHALLFLIRLLGEENAAASWKGAQPYSDVPLSNYYLPYIGYAKEKGYTTGVGNNKFGLGQDSNMKQMATFALRGLGYSDAANAPEFTYANSLTFAKQKGILVSDKQPSTFSRGDAVDVLFGSIAADVKGKDYDLLSKLMNNGSVSQAQYDKAMDIAKGTKPTASVAVADGEYTLGLMGNAVRVSSGKLELRNTTRQVYTVVNKDGFAYIKAEDGKYVALDSVKDGARLITSSSPYSWVIKKQSGSNYTVRPYSNQDYVVNASGEKSADGTHVIIWKHSSAPKHALMTFSSSSTTNPTSVTLNKTSLILAIGGTYDLDATVKPSNAKKSVTYSSNNSEVAKVSDVGVVTAVKAGTATITVKTHNGKTATCKVTVSASAEKYTDKTLNLYNSTNQNVTDIRISSTKNKDWGNNLSGGTVRPNGKVAILVPVSANDYTYDIQVTYGDGSTATFAGYNFKTFQSGSSLYAYLDKGTPILSTTKPANTEQVAPPDEKPADNAVDSKALTDRFNKYVDRYNKLVDEVNKIDGLKNDKGFIRNLNSVSESITDIGKVIGEGTGIYTSEQIATYNIALDSLDALMRELDALIAVAKGQVSTPATKTVKVKFINDTTADFTGFKAQVQGGSGSSPETLRSSGTSTLQFTIADEKTVFTVEFTENINKQPYNLEFTFDKSIKDGATLNVQFNVDKEGNIVYSQN